MDEAKYNQNHGVDGSTQHLKGRLVSIYLFLFSPPFEVSAQSLISIVPQTFGKSPDKSIVLNINRTRHNALFMEVGKCWIVLFYI